MSFKISGYRKGYSSARKAADLDLAASINNVYYTYTDQEYLSTGIKQLLDTSKVILGEQISKRSNENYLKVLKDNRKNNYSSLWYESGWFRNFRGSGQKIKFSKTYYPLNAETYSTENSQAVCLDRILTANFNNDGAFPYDKPDAYGYPEGISSGQKFKICGFIRTDLPYAAFISPYKNIFEIRDHSGYQLASVGRNYWSKEELKQFGLSDFYATIQASGIMSGTNTGQKISYNKIYFQDNIPNLDWCIQNRCSFVYTEILSERNSLFDDPLRVKKTMGTMRRVFVFSGAVNWLPTGEAPDNFSLGYGPYFQPNNTGLSRLYNNNFSLNQSGTLNDKEAYNFVVINSGEVPKNFYLSSLNSSLEIIDDKYKQSQFVYRNSHPLSGQAVKYYTIGKNNSLRINYLHNYSNTGNINQTTLPNGTKLNTLTGAIILHEVTGTILENGKLSFLTKDSTIRGTSRVISNNSRIFFDDYFFSLGKGSQIITVQETGNNLIFDTEGSLLKVNTNGQLTQTNSNIFGLTAFATGLNINSEQNNLKSKFSSGIRSIPSYQAHTNVTVNQEESEVLTVLNTSKQYLKYNEGFSGLFKVNNQLSYTKNNFNPITGAVQLDLLFRIKKEALPTFDLTEQNQEFLSVVCDNLSNPPEYNYYNTVNNQLSNLKSKVLKKGYKYNLLQTNLTQTKPLAIRGDISGLKVTEPNFNKISGDYRLLQFYVNENASNIDFFSISADILPTGKFALTGSSIYREFNPMFRTQIVSLFQLPASDRIERSGAKVVYRFDNQFYPKLSLETDKIYTLNVYSGYTGFYFYTGSSIFGSGLNPYSGSAISYTEPSGALVDSGTLIITGYTKSSIRVYTISAGHIPNNLYYGDRYSAYAGNKVDKISPIKDLSLNKFKIVPIPKITGAININTSDDTKQNININYQIVQDTGNLEIA